MTDHGYPIRQDFIRAYTSLEAKRIELRERLHRENKALVGEEVEAKRRGWTVFKAQKGWETK